MIIRIGTRGSKLASIQASQVEQLFNKNFPNITTKIIKIKTTGDLIQNKPLNEIGNRGLFIKEIEHALLNNEIDIAVHSVKDVPILNCLKTIIPCILKRESPYDALISPKYNNINSLPIYSTVGTSSVRRKVQLLKIRPDLQIKTIRGNIDTRLKKVFLNEFDAIVLAEAGLKRINKSGMINQIFDSDMMLSAVGQGAICIQCRSNDDFIIDILRSFNHFNSFLEVSAERYFMKAVNGSCNTPLAALAQFIDRTNIKMKCMLAHENKVEFSDCIFNINELEKSSLNIGYQLKNKLNI